MATRIPDPTVSSPDEIGSEVVLEQTRSVCPDCRTVLDATVFARDGKVYLRKRCEEHGNFEALVYADSAAYTDMARWNRPGKAPLRYSTEVRDGCPHDCGLCGDHQQHVCVGIIEVNSACDMDCPLCFADAGAGFSLSLSDVEEILDHLVATEGAPEVVQFSGGEPTIHPRILPMLRAAKDRGIPYVMLNTNGKRIAGDDAFVAELADVQPTIYFQFDGFETSTYEAIRGEPGILDEKLRALDRLAEARCPVVLVPAIEREVNEHEVGRIVRFGLEHPAVFGITFQPAFHAGRHGPHDPLQRMTNPDLLRLIEQQTDGLFLSSDFAPVPCCYPTCNSVTYAYVEDELVLPLTRLLDVEEYLDLVTNRAVPEVDEELRAALQGLWSSAAVPGSAKTEANLETFCSACGLDLDLGPLSGRMFMIMLQDFMDPWTFNQRTVMKCCKEILLPDGKQIPFCAYNSVGYREQARPQLARRQRVPAGEPKPDLEFRF